MLFHKIGINNKILYINHSSSPLSRDCVILSIEFEQSFPLLFVRQTAAMSQYGKTVQSHNSLRFYGLGTIAVYARLLRCNILVQPLFFSAPSEYWKMSSLCVYAARKRHNDHSVFVCSFPFSANPGLAMISCRRECYTGVTFSLQ